MAVPTYWADKYAANRRSAAGGHRHDPARASGCSSGPPAASPSTWCARSAQASGNIKDIEVTRLFNLESTPLALISDRTGDQALNIRSFYSGSARTQGIARNKRFITPINLSAVPRLFKSRLLPVHVALIQVSPPDDFGWMSLGVSVDITLAAAESADLVVAQVNPRMPRVLGRSFIHVNDVDVFVEHDEPLISVGEAPEFEAAKGIARMIATRLVDDGSTIAIGLGATSEAVLLALADKNDLGVHTQYLAADTLRLFARGVITNRKKGYHDGKIVAASAIGNEAFYALLNDNPAIEFHPSRLRQRPVHHRAPQPHGGHERRHDGRPDRAGRRRRAAVQPVLGRHRGARLHPRGQHVPGRQVDPDAALDRRPGAQEPHRALPRPTRPWSCRAATSSTS